MPSVSKSRAATFRKSIKEKERMQKKEKQHMPKNANNLTNNKAYIITGPTSGIGLATALEMANHGTVVLVGRDSGKLSKVQKAIQQKRGRAVSVVCDLS